VYDAYTKCFYTALIGNPGEQLDTLGSFDRIPGWDYICFTNQPIPYTQGWTIVQVDYTGTNSALEAKKYKWLSHNYLADYDIAVWTDAYLAPNPKRHELIQSWVLSMKERGANILHRIHPDRNCVWEECKAVLDSKRDTERNVKLARNFLQSIKMPSQWGLFDTCILIKMNKNVQLQHLCEHLYNHLCKTSYRDQLAVSPIYFKEGYTHYSSYQLMNAFEAVGNHVRITV